jgi:hypothetical protein
MDALLENAIRHTRDGDPIQLSVTGPGGPGSAWPWCARSPTRTAGEGSEFEITLPALPQT